MTEPAVRRVRRAAVLLTAAALLLRLLGARGHALDMDELLQLYVAVRPESLAELLSLMRSMPLHPPLDPLLTRALAGISSELGWLRLQPALLGAACVPALIALSRRLGDATALLAGALLAVSVHHVEFSGFVDFYPFMVLWALATTALLLRAVEDGRRRAFAAYAAGMAGFLYTHPWAALVAIFHGGWVLGRRRGMLRPFLLSALAAAAAFLPWLLYAGAGLLDDPRVRYDFPQPSPLKALWTTLECWAGAPERGFFEPGPFKPWTAVATPLHAALAALGVARLTRGHLWTEAWALAAALAFGGPLAVLLLDRVSGYDYAPRQALFALPFFLLFVARGALALRELSPARLAPGALAAALLLLGGLALAGNRELSRQLTDLGDGCRRLAGRVRADARPGQTLLFDEPNHAARFLFYFDRPAVLRLEPPRRFGNVYSLGLPAGLTAAGYPVETVWRPHETLEDEARRWRELAAKVADGRITRRTSDFAFLRPIAAAKTLEFRERHARAFLAAPREGR